MERGYVKLWRKSMDNRIFSNPDLWKVWTWCLMKANHKNNWMSIKTGRGFTEIKVEKGQFIFGRNTAAKELDMKPSTIWKRMLKLETVGNLNIQSNKVCSIITICNWESYQEKVTDKEQVFGTTSERQVKDKCITSDTNKNDKHVENVKNVNKKDIVFIKKIIEYLNLKTGKNFKANTETTKKHINARLKEKYVFEDFKKVIDIKTAEWTETEYEKYLQPNTLFGPKFENYLNQKPFIPKEPLKKETTLEKMMRSQNEAEKERKDKKAQQNQMVGNGEIIDTEFKEVTND